MADVPRQEKNSALLEYSAAVESQTVIMMAWLAAFVQRALSLVELVLVELGLVLEVEIV